MSFDLLYLKGIRKICASYDFSWTPQFSSHKIEKEHFSLVDGVYRPKSDKTYPSKDFWNISFDGLSAIPSFNDVKKLYEDHQGGKEEEKVYKTIKQKLFRYAFETIYNSQTEEIKKIHDEVVNLIDILESNISSHMFSKFRSIPTHISQVCDTKPIDISRYNISDCKTINSKIVINYE